jgi:uncharacterized membrane protein
MIHSTQMRAGTPVWLNQAVRTFLGGRNLAELSLLWAVHLVLATVILVPGTPLDALRPVVAFVYLLVVPGALLVRLLRVYEEDTLAQIVTAVGLSLIYSMVLGLALSGIPSAVIERPLDAKVFLPTSLVITVALYLLVRTEQSLLTPFAQFARPSSLAWALLPFAAVFVALHVRDDGSTAWMAVFLATLAAMPLVLLLRRPTAAECAAAVFSIALALAFHRTFVALDVPVGGDIRREAYFASQVLEAGRWSPQATHIYHAMLSITVLPAAMSSALAVDLATIFKILFGVVLALIPVVLFLISRSFFGVRLALVAALLYLGYFLFGTMAPTLTKQVVATLLVALITLTISNSERDLPRIRALHVVLGIGVVFTHYSMVPIVLIVLGSGLLLSRFARSRIAHGHTQFMSLPSWGVLLTVGAFSYFWFTWASGENLFTTFIAIGERISRAIAEGLLFNTQAVSTSIGILPAGISFPLLLLTNWGIVLAALFGFVVCLHGTVHRDSRRAQLAVLGCGGLLLGGVFYLLPETSERLSTIRASFIVLLWLAPLSVCGVAWVFRCSALSRDPWRGIVAALGALALYFYVALGTGLVTYVLGEESFSHPLDASKEVSIYDQAVVHFASVYVQPDATIYTDKLGRERLYLEIYHPKRSLITSDTLPVDMGVPFFLYMREENLAGQWIIRNYSFGTEYSLIKKVEEAQVARYVNSLKDRINLIYSNGRATFFAWDGVAQL